MKIKNQILGVWLVAVFILLIGCNPLIDERDSGDETGDEVHEAETVFEETGDESHEAETVFEEAGDEVHEVEIVFEEAGDDPDIITCYDGQLHLEIGVDKQHIRDKLSVYTKCNYAIWWDPEFDDKWNQEDAEILVSILEHTRQDTINNLRLQDPPNIKAGYYLNVYVHHDKEDVLNARGAGVGTEYHNGIAMPNLTIPHQSTRRDSPILWHEAFHLFQWCADKSCSDQPTNGFSYSGNSMWFIEASAQWYTAYKLKTQENLFIEVAAISQNPHLTMWHSFNNNKGINDPDHETWIYGVRQYAMHSFLYYLTSIKNVPESTIVDGFYSGTDKLPQEYLYYHKTLTSGYQSKLPDYFADWSAANVSEYSYLTRKQYQRAQLELQITADFYQETDKHPYICEVEAINLKDEGMSSCDLNPEINGELYLFEPHQIDSDGYFIPSDYIVTRPWSYNVFKIKNIGDLNKNQYQVKFESNNSYPNSYFKIKIVIEDKNNNYRTKDFPLDNGKKGDEIFEVNNNDQNIYIVIISVPEQFEGHNPDRYRIKINVQD